MNIRRSNFPDFSCKPCNYVFQTKHAKTRNTELRFTIVIDRNKKTSKNL